MLTLLDWPTKIKWSGFILGALVAILYLLDPPIDLREGIKLLNKAILIEIFLLGLVGKVLWRRIWRLFPSLNQKIFPDLNGEWRGSIRSNWPEIARLIGADCRGEIEDGLLVKSVSVAIVQDFFRLKLTLDTHDRYSRSVTLFATPIRDDVLGKYVIAYTYKNITNDPKPTDEQFHMGSGYISFEPNGREDQLRGCYWTNRKWKEGQNTAGLIALSRA